MKAYRIWGALALIAGGFFGYIVWTTEMNPESAYRFRLGLDLAGGTELVYRAHTDETAPSERDGALAALQNVIERRVNLFGVAEPLVQTERAGAISGNASDRLIVDLPGVTDVDAAIAALGATPVLEFKIASTTTTATTTSLGFEATGLTGRYLDRASLQFGTGATAGLAAPIILLSFNKEGADLFEKITRENTGEVLAIFLDGQPISTPIIREPIAGGEATITGDFSAIEARDLVKNLNFGALPIPIELENTSSVGPTLGSAAITAGVFAGSIGFIIVALFMILWYRLPGIIAVIALTEYVAFMLVAIKVIPITLTASGIAAFIVSVGMAVDANVLIFERTKEELREGKGPREAVHIGFARAWPAIRDGHLTGLISGAILFWLGTSIVKGFALVFMLGILASFISAVSLSRIFLLSLVPEARSRKWLWFLHSGFRSPHTNL